MIISYAHLQRLNNQKLMDLKTVTIITASNTEFTQY